MFALTIRRVQVVSLAKALGVFGAFFGLLACVVNTVLYLAIPSLRDPIARMIMDGPLSAEVLAMFAVLLVGTPLIWSVCWFVIGLVGGIIFNAALRITGGLTVEVESRVVLSHGSGKHGSLSYEDYIRRHVPTTSE